MSAELVKPRKGRSRTQLFVPGSWTGDVLAFVTSRSGPVRLRKLLLHKSTVLALYPPHFLMPCHRTLVKFAFRLIGSSRRCFPGNRNG